MAENFRRTLPSWLATARVACAGALAFCLAGWANSASAQVIEVGPDGARTLSGPALITPDGVRPIAPPQAAASPGAQPPPAGVLERAGAASDLSPRLLEAIAYVESRFDAAALSPKGAVGMMQLMPATAAGLGVDPHNQEQNARGGAAYLRQMLARFDNNVELAVAAYNAGPAAVIRHGGVPPFPETQAYVAAVMAYLAKTAAPETK